MSPTQLHILIGGVPTFILVLCRVGGVMVFAPLFGSGQVPKRVRGLLAIIMSMGMVNGLARPPHLPTSLIETTVALAGELAFGVAMGMVLSFVFIAAQWAGQIVGQQIGFNIAETFDPQYGSSSTVVGDMYYMLTLVVFLSVGGHRQVVAGLRDSFDAMPLLTVGVDRPIFDIVLRSFTTATVLAARLAAPVLVTMLVVDMVLGFLGKTIPQLNVMAAGMSLKAMIGIAVLALGMMLYATPAVLERAVLDSVQTVRLVWAGRG
jgi:flagellar biosynthetic protein FliR